MRREKPAGNPPARLLQSRGKYDTIFPYRKDKPEGDKPLSFQQAITSVFQKYLCFSGRARRSEYWYFALLNWVVTAVLTAVVRNTDSSFASLLLSLWNIAVLLPGLGVCWRRLHDIGRSGAWFFLNLVPLVGQIILLVWLCRDSQPGWNQYGDSPKYPSGGYGGGYGQGGYGQQGGYTQNPYGQNGSQNNGSYDWKT